MLDVSCAVPSPSQTNRPGSSKTPYFYRARRASNQFMNRHSRSAADPTVNLQLTVPECNPRPGFSFVGTRYNLSRPGRGRASAVAASLQGAIFVRAPALPSPRSSFRTKQADFFFRIRSCECVDLRREKSLFASIVAASPQAAILPFAFPFLVSSFCFLVCSCLPPGLLTTS
jgi:hypothetical protein